MILKLLYLIFSNPKSSNLFYRNDLKVLIDVIVRELYNCEVEKDEKLRHAYLRVLFLLVMKEYANNSSNDYKKKDIRNLLESLHKTNVCPDTMDQMTRELAIKIASALDNPFTAS